MNIFLTGATGFVGGALLRHLKANTAHQVTIGLRQPDAAVSALADHTLLWGLTQDEPPNLEGIDCVIHAAARVHQLRETAADPLAAFRAVNTTGTLRLAQAAIAAGVKRFVYVSTIHVNGHEREQPYTANDQPQPTDPYGISKWEAEQGLQALKDQLEIVIVRPPLVYGPNAPGNFGRLVRAVERGLPLPFGAIDNRRSLIALDNLVDFLRCAAEHPRAAGETFLVSDGAAVSTPELVRQIATALQRSPRLLAVSPRLLAGLFALVGKPATFQRLGGSLWIDDSPAQTILGWRAPLSMAQAMKQIATESNK
jgi:nucleoside-diphosphate-sugar epimerase